MFTVYSSVLVDTHIGCFKLTRIHICRLEGGLKHMFCVHNVVVGFQSYGNK